MERWLEDLNPQQLRAVTHNSGPLLIVSGSSYSPGLRHQGVQRDEDAAFIGDGFEAEEDAKGVACGKYPPFHPGVH